MRRSRKTRAPQLSAALPSEDVKKNGVLGEKWGGRIPLRKSYCLFYYARPRKSSGFMPCCGYVDEVTGNRLVPECPDLVRCLKNPAGSGNKKKPYDGDILPDPSTRKKR